MAKIDAGRAGVALEKALRRDPGPDRGADCRMGGPWRVDPYLHVGQSSVFNPHTDRTLTAEDERFSVLIELLNGPGSVESITDKLESLVDEGWLIRSGIDPDRLFRLKYISLEAHTVCNQKCYFCPVSVAPRAAEQMPFELYERIVDEIAELRQPIEAVFMNGYNDPTTDPRFLDLVGCLRSRDLPPAVLTNGAGLTPKHSDRIVEMGGLAYLCVNLSTLDKDRYRIDRGRDHLEAVLRNLDHARDLPLAPRMEIVVLGSRNEQHSSDFDEIRRHFRGSRFGVRLEGIDDRAAYFGGPDPAAPRRVRLGGCQQMGSRPIQHLHINPRGECVLCCQDYNETVVVGDLKRSSVLEILESPAFASARRRVYGIDEAPEDFICTRCRFALRR